MAAGGGEDLSFLPSSLRNRLMPFQREGVKFAIRKQGRCLIGDEMGLGKTIQAIAVTYYYKSEWPVLIVVPSSLKYPWVEEFEKWLPELQPNDINMIMSSTDTSGISTSKVSIMSYGLLRNEYQTLLQALTDQNFQVIVVDESHYIKNMKTARTKLLLPLVQNSKRAILLTGTPALSRPAELFPQVQALKNKLLGSWTSYAKRYCNAQWRHFGRHRTWDTGGASNLPELHSMLKQHIMIRREKKQVLTELPPKRRQKIPFVLNDTPQKKEVDRLLEELWKVMKGEVILDEGMNPKMVINGLISSLYIKTAEAKAGAVREYIKTLLDNDDQKFLVFAHHHFMLDAVTQTLLDYNKEHHTKIKHIRIDGTVPGAERARLVKLFQTDDSVKVAILSILAAGTGLTFTAATQVVFAELHWTPGVMDQCEDRAHRIGQKSSIQVHYLVARGTIDDFIWSAITRKVSVVSHALSGQLKHLNVGECNKEDVEFLSHAAAWLPSNQDDDDDDEEYYFNSQGVRKQPSILTFFTPRNKSSPKKRKKTKSPLEFSQPVKNTAAIITIDSDDDDFQNQPIRKKSRTDGSESQPIGKSPGSHVTQNSQSDGGTRIDLSSVSGSDSDLPEVFSTPAQDARGKRGRKTAKTEVMEEAVSDRSWSCSACTFENHDELPFCEICDTPRKLQVKRKTRSAKQHPETSWIHGAEDIDDANTKSDDVSTKNDDVKTGTSYRNKGGGVLEIGRSPKQTKENNFDSSVDSDDTIVDYYSGKSDDITADIDNISSQSDTESYDITAESDDASLSNTGTPTVRRNKHKRLNVHRSEAISTSTPQSVKGKLKNLTDSGKKTHNIEGSSSKNYQGRSSDVDQPGCSDKIFDPNVKDIPVYERFHYCASRYTDRIYLYDEGKEPLGVCFVPIDVLQNDLDNLPELLHEPRNLKLVKRFVREWSSLHEMKRRQVRKSGEIFHSAFEILHDLRTKTQSESVSKKRYLTKADLAQTAVEKASAIGGSLRVITKHAATPASRKGRNQSNRKTKIKTAGNDLDSKEMDELLKLAEIDDDWSDDDDVTVSGSTCNSDGADRLNQSQGFPSQSSDGKSNRQSLWNTKRQSDIDSSGSESPSGCPFGLSSQTGQSRKQPTTGKRPELTPKGTSKSAVKQKDKTVDSGLKTDLKNSNRSSEQQTSDRKHLDMHRPWSTLDRTNKRATPSSHKYHDQLSKTGRKNLALCKSESESDSGASQADNIHGYFMSASRAPRSNTNRDNIHVVKTGRKSQNRQEGNSDECSYVRVSVVDDEAFTDSDSFMEEFHDKDVSSSTLPKLKRPNRVQVVDSEGRPLCLYCDQPCKVDQSKPSTSNKNTDWDTRYCSEKCKEDHYVRAKGGYVREQLSEIEHGKCQICGLDAHDLYLSVKSRPKKERKEFLSGTKFSKLPTKILNTIIDKPSEGKFWQADHIVPVADGGGLCSLENFRTLCTVCHRSITDVQAKQRNKEKKIQARRSAGFADITTFFKPS
ncbi:DNA annealing helicase and endonuclease ZRANB3-like [Ptychodera flava]|uniref:DNA annealing helicase and endonuclease ZRANB3-like n=1 Tax=Ptychodera flava TaxID=63121 RepID=UPI00396A3B1C